MDPTIAHPSISTVGQAARYGNKELLLEFIAQGKPVDCGDNRGWKPTHEAANGNHVDCLEILLKHKHTSVEWECHLRKSALLMAAEKGNQQCAELLLSHGADPNQIDSMDVSPLIAGVQQKSLSLVKLLVEKGANVDATLYNGCTPLHQAATDGSTDILRYLLDHDARLDIREENGITPIFTAAHHGNEPALRLLLEETVKREQVTLVNAAAEDGATPIYLAAQEGHSNCVKTLIEFYADVNLFTMVPKALPLHAAVQFNHIDCVELLLPITDVDIVNECDLSPYYFSITHPDAFCTEYLCKNGLNCNTRHRMLHDDEYEPKVLRYFQNNVKFSKCVTPITLVAAYEGYLTNAKVLLAEGARVNPQTTYEVPPLLPALDTFNFDLAELLIAHGATLNLYHPRVKGNLAVLICLYNWRGMELVLKCGAEVESLFRTDRNVWFGEEDWDLRRSRSEREDDMSMSEEEEYEQEIGEPSRSAALQFWRILAEARYIMSRRGVTVGRMLYRILQFTGSIQLDPRILAYVDSEEEAQELRQISAAPRPLTHLSRLSIRKQLSPQKLLNENVIKSLPMPQALIDYLLFSNL